MRSLTREGLYKRGCIYCLDMVRKPARWGNFRTKSCPYDVCPYEVLDKYKSYDEFIESEDSRILTDAFFDTGAHEARFTFVRKRGRIYEDEGGLYEEEKILVDY